MPSNLLYGLDNYIWGVVGYSGFNGQINGKPFQFGQAAYQVPPDGSDFEVMTGSTNNTWGLGFSETFDVFGSTANNDPSWSHGASRTGTSSGIEGLPVASGSAASAPATRASRRSTACTRSRRTSGRSTCSAGTPPGAGHLLYTARQFPKEYWNRIAFINEPTAHVIGQGILEKQGAGFVTRDGWNLAASAEEWFAPVHTQVGPDGAVWVSDWYNFIIQHNPTPTGLQQRPGQRLRVVAARSPARAHLPDRLQERASGAEALAVDEGHGGPRRRRSRPTTCSGA